MFYRTATFPLILTGVQGHSIIASLFKRDFSHTHGCAANDKMSTETERHARCPSCINRNFTRSQIQADSTVSFETNQRRILWVASAPPHAVKAKFHTAILVADRSEARRRPIADLLARC